MVLAERDHVSVVLPYLNRADVLAESIRSVLHQTHKDLTLILVDDGSDDGSRQIAESINDPRIVHVSTRGCTGPCSARNQGLLKASSSLVAFQDSDDLWKPEKLSTQVAAMRQAQSRGLDASVVGCGWQYLGQRGAWKTSSEGPYRRSDVFADRVRGIGTPMLLVDRDRAGAVLFDEQMPAREDQDFVISCLDDDNRLLVVPAILAEVRRGRTDHQARPMNSALGYERFLEKYAQDLDQDPELNSWLHFRAARDFVHVRKPLRALEHWPMARRRQPLKRAVHLLCGLLAGDKGFAVAALLAPIWDPRKA